MKRGALKCDEQSPFGASHFSEAKEYAEQTVSSFDENEFAKEYKQRDKWLSTLPKETKDREVAQPGIEAFFDQFEENFYLSHREEYPQFSMMIADDHLEKERARSSRCIASDDSRLKEK